MRIGIFPAIVGRRGGGVETFELNLVRSLAEQDQVEELLVFCLQRSANQVGSHLKTFLQSIAERQCYFCVITSNLSCMPEVVDEAAILVDPYVVTDIARAMANLFDDPDLQFSLRAKGLERSKQFSWDRTASKNLEVYSNVLAM